MARIVFMGTPEFAVPALERLASRPDVSVCLVVSQPDRPAGRGRKLVSPPVTVAAEGLGLPVLQVSTLRDPEARRRIVEVRPDLVVVAAFGMILGRWILALPARGCVNVHASLLPKYRGASPIAAALAMGETMTGVSLMRMDAGLDTGDVLARVEVGIRPDDTAESLGRRLAVAGAELLDAELGAIVSGRAVAVPQGPGATMTRPMVKDDGWLDFRRSAHELERHVRAMWPWPRAWTTMPDGQRLQIHRAAVVEGREGEPGMVVREENRQILVATGAGALWVQRVQFAGGRPLDGHALLSHPALVSGIRLGVVGAPERLPPLVEPVGV